MLLSISFDIAGLIILSVLLISVYLRKLTRGWANKVFICTMVNGLMSCLCEIWAVLMDYNPNATPGLIGFSHGAFLVFQTLQAPLLAVYIISLTDTWHKLHKKPALRVLLGLPYVATFLMLMTNPLTKIMFTYDNGYEHASFLFYLGVYILIIPYYVVYCTYTIKYRSQFTPIKIVALFSVILLTIISIVIHLVVPELRVNNFAVAVSQLMLCEIVQKAEEIIDTSTGLHKRYAYVRDIKHAYDNNKRMNVVMLNLANYEQISEMMGYDNTVEVVSRVAGHIRNITRSLKCDCMCYYLQRGRYQIVFSEKDYDKARLAAEYILNDIRIRFRVNGFDVNLLPCIILAKCPEEINSYQSMMQFSLHFHEKQMDHNRWYSASELYSSKEFEIRNNINEIIARGLRTKKFEIYYQPIYSTVKNKFVSAEALLRLYDDEYGFISPEILVPAAERTGAIHKIGRIVFEEVCKFVSSVEYSRLGLEYIEVNLSVAQCMRSDLADDILEIMDRYKITPKELNLEITETAASFSQRAMMDNLTKLSEAGLEFSLDDYGTGYSNMKRVISLPLKIVKLDKSLVDEWNNPKMSTFLRHTVKMMKDMNVEIVVEGIETEDMVKTFSNLGCDFIQGYYFSKPVCREDFVKFIRHAVEASEAGED